MSATVVCWRQAGGRIAPAVFGAAFLLATATAPAGARRHLESLPENVQTTEQVLAAARQAGGNYEVHLTSHYVIVYSGPLEIAKARGALLERCYNAFFTFMRHMGFDLAAPPHKLTVIVFDDERQFDAYRRNEGLAVPDDPLLVLQGYYSSATNRSAFFNQHKSQSYLQTRASFERLAASLERIPGPPETEVTVTTDRGRQVTTKGQATRELQELAEELQRRFAEENQQVTQHEGAHQLAFNTGVQKSEVAYPFWVPEGLACLFETPPSLTTFSAYRVNMSRLDDYRRLRDEGRLLGLADLASAHELPADRIHDAYAESWGLFFFLLKRRPQELRAYLKELTERQRAGDADRPADELPAFARHFGDDLGAVEQQWRLFMDRLIAANE